MPQPRIGTRALASPPIITPVSRCALGGGISRLGFGAAGTGVSPWSDAANTVLGFPFIVEAPTTIYKGFWVNGSSVGNNSEVCVLAPRLGVAGSNTMDILATTGSVGNSGASVPQAAAFSGGAITLSPGIYYAGLGANATTTNRYFRWSVATTGAGFWMTFGCWKSNAITLGSLGSTLTQNTLTNVAFPLFGLITRSAYDV